MNLPDPKNPLWNKKICPRPWTETVTASFSTYTCCFNPAKAVNTFPSIWNGGPYIHKDIKSWWNTEPFQKFRKEMYEKGSFEACKGIGCPFNLKADTTLGYAGYYYLNEYGEEVNKILLSILNGDEIVDYHPIATTTVVKNTCDSNCAFCIQYSDPKEELSAEGRENLSIFLGKCKKLILLGGEIFMMKDEELDILFKHIPFKNLSIVTNGHFVTPERFQKYVIDGPVETLSISLNTCSIKEYKNKTMKKNFFEIDGQLTEFMKMKPDFDYTISFLITSSVIKYIPDIIEFANKHNCKKIYFPLLEPYTLIKRGLEEENLFGKYLDDELLNRFKYFRKLAEDLATKYEILIGSDSLGNIQRKMEDTLKDKSCI